MPFVPEALLSALVAGAAGGGYDAFLPESSGRRGLEPLCAVYGPACAPAIARRLDSGDLQAISFHADVRVGILSLAEVKAFGDPDELFFNVISRTGAVIDSGSNPRSGDMFRVASCETYSL